MNYLGFRIKAEHSTLLQELPLFANDNPNKRILGWQTKNSCKTDGRSGLQSQNQSWKGVGGSRWRQFSGTIVAGIQSRL